MKSQHSNRYQAAIRLLKDSRTKKGLTQSNLAERLGTRQQFVSKYESGERRLDIIEFFDVAHALGITDQEVVDVCGTISLAEN